VLGQPTLSSTTLASRCANADARFNFRWDPGFGEMFGPSGIAVDAGDRLYVTDYGGQRVLTWPNFEALEACLPADGVIGAGDLSGPEAVVVDAGSGTVFVADTLSHTVKGYRRAATGAWTRVVQLGTQNVPGAGVDQFHFPRGLAVDPNGRLFVADGANQRVLVFDPPFADGAAAVDSIGAGHDGGFDRPKGLAMVGHTLFVADSQNDRVLRFTGPFDTPDQVYTATATFTGVASPVDVAVHPDGSLLVTDQGNQRIARYGDAAFSASAAAPTSTFSDHLGPEPLGIAADRTGRIYAADYRRFRVLIRDEFVIRAPIGGASTTAAEAVLADLRAGVDGPVQRVAIGQQLITYLYGPKSDPNAWYGDWRQLERGGFRLPKIMAGELSDLMSYPGFAPNQDALNELIAHGRRGHFVSLVWHPDNPVPGGQFGVPVSTAALRSMVNDATTIGRNWQVQLNRAAAVLQQFKKAGVPVGFRPLHEQNGDFFWWGHNGATGAALSARQAAWVAVWRDLVTDLKVRKGLNNLFFVFGTNQVTWSGIAPPLTYYPGGGWVDAVSIDVYDEELDLAGSARGLQHYAALVNTGKPFGLAEFGQSADDNGTGLNAAAWDARTLVRRIRDSYPRTAFAIAWYSSVEDGKRFVFALPDVSFSRELLNDPLIWTQ
jgi:mannan endo-1,4-beta-mannosidase